MDNVIHEVDALVIGGGFYGTTIASHLVQKYGFKKVTLVEKEKKLFARASLRNQARVHNGYHYPRSYSTAYRSRINLPNFIHRWPESIVKNFQKIYAIAKQESKVTSKQFIRFCNEIGAKIEPASDDIKSLFNLRNIEDVFLVEEYAFNGVILGKLAELELKELNVEILASTQALSFFQNELNKIRILLKNENGLEFSVIAKYVLNCTYSGLNQFETESINNKFKLKHEIAELALLKATGLPKEIGVTVMDGPFFSFMPYPAKEGLHSLSHVRYTPHLSWIDEKGLDPYQKLENYKKETRVDRMMRDAAKYMPCIMDQKYIDSIYEIKTVLVKNEIDDGRPILFERNEKLQNYYSVLGGKLDNIFDVLERLDEFFGK